MIDVELDPKLFGAWQGFTCVMQGALTFAQMKGKMGWDVISSQEHLEKMQLAADDLRDVLQHGAEDTVIIGKAADVANRAMMVSWAMAGEVLAKKNKMVADAMRAGRDKMREV